MSDPSQGRRAVYNARPVVRINGQGHDRVNELLLAMDMREQEGGLSSLELRLSNIASDPDGGAGYAFEDESEIALGAAITVAAGDITDPREIFRGMITGLEAEFPEAAPPELVVLAEDRLQQARMGRRSQVYQDQSVADVAREIAGRLGLEARITGLSSPVGIWVQLNESDLAFLRRLLHLFDADVQVVEDRLEVAPVAEIRRQVIALELFHDLRSVRFIADLAHQVTEVTSSGWNPVRGQTVSGRCQALSPAPGSGRLGADLLRSAIGERSEHVGQIAVATDDEARALADTVFARRARAFVTALGTATGNPDLRVGSHLQLSGVSPRFAGTYYVVSAHHRFDLRQGYQTDFRAQCPTLGEAA
jgi:phage protein D